MISRTLQEIAEFFGATKAEEVKDPLFKDFKHVIVSEKGNDRLMSIMDGAGFIKGDK